MRSKKLRCFASVLLAVAMIFSSLPASLQARAEEKGSSGRWESADDPTLRDYAVPSVSFVGWGQGPDNFADENMDTFWNGHSDEDLASYNQWMMYDWSEFGEAEVSGSTIQFFDDGGGVMAPTGITIEYDENGAWKEVTKKGDWSFAANTVNTYEFEPVTTTKIRVTMAHAVSGSEKVAVAVNDWKLIGEVPDSFPKPEAVEPEAPSEDLKLGLHFRLGEFKRHQRRDF